MFAGKDAETEMEARCCIVCRTPLPSTARADARLCSPACRQRARRRDHVTLRVMLPSASDGGWSLRRWRRLTASPPRPRDRHASGRKSGSSGSACVHGQSPGSAAHELFRPVAAGMAPARPDLDSGRDQDGADARAGALAQDPEIIQACARPVAAGQLLGLDLDCDRLTSAPQHGRLSSILNDRPRKPEGRSCLGE
jgi:hypothetical protein